ncbi:MAG: hypothetical protein A2Z15_08665 [Chloroflexi bacterium RBG_16_50_11]|nr:MAG: hypothetical protein A2Z15_08665 [Chloroflexi bacterium RBG_16_50_11]
MPTANELLRQGRTEELWQMCCGFLSLNINEFMAIQRRLLEQQLELLNNSPLGQKVMHGARPRTLEEFRRLVPLTNYVDYAEDFMEKREDILPEKRVTWVRTSGRTGDYPCKWIPMTDVYAEHLSKALYGVGIFSCCRDWGDTDRIPDDTKLLYGVAPRPYISGTFADVLRLQTPVKSLPSLEEAEKLTYEERISKGFQEALSFGLDYFFGLSLVLVKVGEKVRDASGNIDVRPYLLKPKALFRLSRGFIKSLIARRRMLPKDIWSLKGIIGSGVDSWVYKEKVKELWGRNPLDLYSCTEGGVIATQTWDYGGMTFIPNLNFLEFIPEDELLKSQMDRSYRPKTRLLNEIEAGQTYEIVITSFHGGALVRYRVGDLVRITSLRNEKLNINIPQMAFERRTDDLLNFMVIKLSEKQIWQAMEKTGFAYEDWAAYKIPGEPVLHLLVEPKQDVSEQDKKDFSESIKTAIVESGRSSYEDSGVQEDWRDTLDFVVDVTLLNRGTFARYIRIKQEEGADLAHLKPPHINPPEKALNILLADAEETIVVTKITEKEKVKQAVK